MTGWVTNKLKCAMKSYPESFQPMKTIQIKSILKYIIHEETENLNRTISSGVGSRYTSA